MTRAYQATKIKDKDIVYEKPLVTIKNNMGNHLHNRQMAMYLECIFKKKGYNVTNFRKTDSDLAFELSLIDNNGEQ